MLRSIWLLLLILPISLSAKAWDGRFANQTQYSVCFTPGGHCTDAIVSVIDHAKNTIDLQAYSFTSLPIINALIEAKRRGVRVDVLLDKSNVKHTYSGLHDLEQNAIPFLVDYQPAIAHNKVMIIDGHTVITGSFNFTKNAQARNAENVLIIDSPELAEQYKENFNQRKRASISLAQYKMKRTSKGYKRHRRHRS